MSSEQDTVQGVTLDKAVRAVPRGISERVRRYRHLGLPLVFVLTVVIFSLLRPGDFDTWSNVRSILVQSSPALILVTGLTVVLAVGDFDLSFTMLLDVVSVVAILGMTSWHLGVGGSLLLATAVGLALGAVVGAAVSRLKSSLVVTLAFGGAFTGMALAIHESSIIVALPQSFLDISGGSVGPLPRPIVIAAVFATLIALVFRFTRLGREVRAVGGNQTAARLAGINTGRVRMAAFAIMGLAVAVAAIVVSSQNSAYYPNSSTGLLLPSYVTAFLGVSMSRSGHFTVLGSVVGVLFLNTLQAGLLLLNQPQWVVNVVSAFVLLAALAFGRKSKSDV